MSTKTTTKMTRDELSWHVAKSIVTKRVKMKVTATMPDKRVFTGTWVFNEPHEWDRYMSQFHKNEGTWCANNLLSDDNKKSLEWDQPEALAAIEQLACSQESSDQQVDESFRYIHCLCDVFEFELLEVVDPTPRRELRPPTESGDTLPEGDKNEGAS